MTNKPLVILASARKQGETSLFLKKVLATIDYTLIDLLDFEIAPFSYSENYSDADDFLKIMETMRGHNSIVFATPVYWYAMSGLLKTFFDRFTDVVTTHKHLGRMLKAKETMLLAVGADPMLPAGFEVPFSLTAAYLEMNYLGCIYHSTKFPAPGTKLQVDIQVLTSLIRPHGRYL